MKEVRTIIKENSSFYDYHLLEYTIELDGADNDKRKLHEYKEAFVAYAQRRVFECPSHFGAKRTSSDTELHVKLDSNYQYGLMNLKNLRSDSAVF